MLEHLLDFQPEVTSSTEAPPPVEKTTPMQALDGKINTSDWLKSMGAPDKEVVVSELEKTQARETFTALTTNAPTADAHAMVSKLETPQAVRHLTSMLTAYDWEFIQQAKELRGYAVAKILEECEHPTASIRLKALALLGKVTEVGLFTEKIEVKKTDMTEDEVDRKLKEKLAKFMDVTDVQPIEDIDVIDVVATPAPPEDEPEKPSE
ncbi:MAG: hypothetical protein EBW87_03625 [Burkholderiaceae bacterium]|jgi:hypothetical protein|nr:hypothetical protein [Burkholderiaceae bacterium]